MNAYMILDLQFGSTGKGLLAGYLAKKHEPDVVVTAWGPNAGHTYINQDGREFIHRMLANGIVSPKLEKVLIGPGSVIDIDILYKEVKSCADILKGKEIIIHPHACVVTEDHRETEARNVKIGSTMKGTGAAVIQRIERDPDNLNTAKFVFNENFGHWIKVFEALGVELSVDASNYRSSLLMASNIQIEGAQGFSLSIYHGLYPYTTSRDVTPAQVMADCAIPYSIKPKIIGTLRTYPIRVANRFNENGEMIGTSGPGYIDQSELSWADIGLKPELTTVTQLPRRIFSWSWLQFFDAVNTCDPDCLFLNFCNYMETPALQELISEIELHKPVAFLGHGPNHDDIVEIER